MDPNGLTPTGGPIHAESAAVGEEADRIGGIGHNVRSLLMEMVNEGLVQGLIFTGVVASGLAAAAARASSSRFACTTSDAFSSALISSSRGYP